MSTETTRERHVVKLHPRLEGKRILFMESHAVFESAGWQNRCRLECIDLHHLGSLPVDGYGTPLSLYEYMRRNDMDGIIIHPETKQHWISEIEELHEKGTPIMIIRGLRGEKGDNAMFLRFRQLGIPYETKNIMGTEFYEALLDGLDAQFAAKIPLKTNK